MPRLARIESHLASAVEAQQEAVESLTKDDLTIRREGHTRGMTRSYGGTAMKQFREELKEAPRISKDLATWSLDSLLHRARALGAASDTISDCIASADSRSELIEVVQELEPPHPQSVSVDDITCDALIHTVEEMAEILERVGALVIKNAASQELMDQVDAQLEEAGAWAISRGKQVDGRPAGRMQMDMLLRAPLTQELVTNEHVLGVTRHVLGPHCKRIALKELSVFEVQPGNAMQGFHREDMFWPWHHEPYPWSTNILWAIDDFTPENGAIQACHFSMEVALYHAVHE